MTRLLLAVLLTATAAAPAAASTIAVSGDRVHFAAGAGEANDVTITLTGGELVATDTAGLQPGEGCQTRDGAVVCPFPYQGVTVVLGDGDDRLAFSDTSGWDNLVEAGSGRDTLELVGRATAEGGPGDDVLSGDHADQTLGGGDGADVLRGTGGNDRLRGGRDDDLLIGGGGGDVLTADSGRDILWGDDDHGAPSTGPTAGDSLDGGAGNDFLDGGHGPDALHGGGGFDTVSYEHRTQPLSADQNRYCCHGEANEADAMQISGAVIGGAGNDTIGASAVFGGAGDDVLQGFAGAQALHGGPGDDDLYGFHNTASRARDLGDVLDGGEGNDRLIGWDGRDAYDAGPGHDAIDAREPDISRTGDEEQLACGDGDDAAHADWNDLPTSCETLRRGIKPPAVLLGPVGEDADPPRGPGPQPPLAPVSQLGDAVLAPVRCAGERACRVTLTATVLVARKGRRARRIAAGRLTQDLPAGAYLVARLPLARAARRSLRARGELRARVDARFSDGRVMARPVVLED